MSDNRLKRFVLFFPELNNVALKKNNGMIPSVLARKYGYQSRIVSYRNGEYPYLQDMPELEVEFVENTGNVIRDFTEYLMEYASDIDVLQLYGLYVARNGEWIRLYKKLNPQGIVYVKLDADDQIKSMQVTEEFFNSVRERTFISVESRGVWQWLNANWPVKVGYIPNGVEYTDGFSILPYTRKKNIILSVGRLGTTQKATEVLLEAFRIAKKELPDWELRLVGSIEEPFKAYLDVFFTAYPEMKKHITFTGEIIDRSQLLHEYEQAKIFCLPSRWEGFALVTFEAGQNGCYMLLTDLVSSRDITDNGKCGTLVPVDNVNALAEGLVACEKNDKLLQGNCGDIQKYIHEKFDWEKICGKIDKKIREYSSHELILNDNMKSDKIYQNAQMILSYLVSKLNLVSIVDFGCGVGTWLKAAQDIGIRDVFGVDFDSNLDALQIPKDLYRSHDLTKKIYLGRDFDLVISLEFAEHLPIEVARQFVATLCRHGQVVMFSAAIPTQGGIKHINEQWQSWWAALFLEQEYVPVDCIRPRFWKENRIEWCYRQNIMLYVSKMAIDRVKGLSCAKGEDVYLDIIHPDLYNERRIDSEKAKGLIWNFEVEKFKKTAKELGVRLKFDN